MAQFYYTIAILLTFTACGVGIAGHLMLPDAVFYFLRASSGAPAGISKAWITIGPVICIVIMSIFFVYFRFFSRFKERLAQYPVLYAKMSYFYAGIFLCGMLLFNGAAYKGISMLSLLGLVGLYVGVTISGIGLLLPTCPYLYVFGLSNKYTKTHEDIWRDVHTRCGHIYFYMGIALAVISYLAPFFLVFALTLTTIVCSVSPYFLGRRALLNRIRKGP